MSFSAVLIWLCSSLEGNEREQGNRSPEILGPLGKLLGDREVAKKQRRMWPTGKWNSRVKVVTEGTDKAIPSCLAVVMSPHPTWLFPKSQYFPLGTEGASSHWPGSGFKGRKGSSGKGAFSRSTRCSRSMQHCGGWRGNVRLLPQVTCLPATS